LTGKWLGIFQKSLHGEEGGHEERVRDTVVLYTDQVLSLTYKKILAKAIAHHVPKVGETLNLNFDENKINAPGN